jgi:hypothetical protein
MNVRLLLIVVGLGAGLWAFRRWRLAIQLALVVLVLEGAIRKWFLLGAQDLVYFAKDALLLAAYAGFWSERGRRGGSWRPQQPILFGLLTLSALFGLLQVFNPELPSFFVGLLGFKSYFLYAPLLIVMPHLFSTDVELARFLRRYLLLSLPVGLLAVAQFFSPATSALNTYARPTDSLSSASSAITFGSSSFVRVTATFSFITGYSAYLITISLLALAWLAARRWRLRGNLLMALVLGTAILGMLMTGSRGPVITLAALFPLYWWLSVGREKQSGATFVRVVAGLVLLAGFLFFVGQDAFGAFQGRASGSGSEAFDRIITPVIAPFQVLPRAGLLGFGIGATHQAATAFTHGLVPFSWLRAGNVEVESGRVMLELGPVGFVLIYLFRLLLALIALRLTMGLSTLFHRSLGVACFLALLAGIPGGIVFDVTSGLLYWFCGGLLFLVVRLDEEAVRMALRRAQSPTAQPAIPVASARAG